MAHDEQLAWEARARRPAAAAAFGAGVFALAAGMYLPLALGGVESDADLYLRDVERQPEHFIVSGVLLALGSLLMLPALVYLFRATRYRRPELAPTALVMAVLGTITFAVVAVWRPIELKSAAEDFFPFTPRDTSNITEAGDYLEAVSPEEAAEDALREALPGAASGIAIGGTLALAFALVMVALNAMRAGLLSRFMGVLGIFVGVLYVIPLGVQIVPLFWFAALGFLFLGRWPGGRGPAWETGEAIPWPSAAEQRGAPPEPEPGALPEPEPEPESRRASRKRRKKRR